MGKALGDCAMRPDGAKELKEVTPKPAPKEVPETSEQRRRGKRCALIPGAGITNNYTASSNQCQEMERFQEKFSEDSKNLHM
jgi:hypothetical protein